MLIAESKVLKSLVVAKQVEKKKTILHAVVKEVWEKGRKWQDRTHAARILRE